MSPIDPEIEALRRKYEDMRGLAQARQLTQDEHAILLLGGCTFLKTEELDRLRGENKRLHDEKWLVALPGHTYLPSDELERLRAELERLGRNSYPHMCQNDHVRVGHADNSEPEELSCPVCRERNEREREGMTLRPKAALCDELEKALRELVFVVEHCQPNSVLGATPALAEATRLLARCKERSVGG